MLNVCICGTIHEASERYDSVLKSSSAVSQSASIWTLGHEEQHNLESRTSNETRQPAVRRKLSLHDTKRKPEDYAGQVTKALPHSVNRPSMICSKGFCCVLCSRPPRIILRAHHWSRC